MRPITVLSSTPESISANTPIEPFSQEALLQQERFGFRGTHESLLVNEVSHRFKNELASVIGVVSVASMRSKNPETRRVLQEVEEKLHDHAKLYDALQMPRDNCVSNASSYLRNLLVALSRAKLERKGVRMVYREFSPIHCSAEQCWTLGMIVSELVTNSLQHAFGECGGTIGVDLLKDNDQITCEVSDSGSCALQIREGNGLKIVRSLVHSLQGRIDQKFGPSGTLSVVSFPRVTTIDRSP
jgi:two-component sensor histidine kinase